MAWVKRIGLITLGYLILDPATDLAPLDIGNWVWWCPLGAALCFVWAGSIED